MVPCTIAYAYPSDSAFEYQYDVQLDNGDLILEVWSYQLDWSDTTEFATNSADQSHTNHTEGTDMSMDNISTTSISVNLYFYRLRSMPNIRTYSNVSVYGTYLNKLHSVSSSSAPLTAAETDIGTSIPF